MKNHGVAVYTVACGSDIVIHSNIAPLTRQCASGVTPEEKAQYVFEAVDGKELNNAFEAIFTRVKQIRIVK